MFASLFLFVHIFFDQFKKITYSKTDLGKRNILDKNSPLFLKKIVHYVFEPPDFFRSDEKFPCLFGVKA